MLGRLLPFGALAGLSLLASGCLIDGGPFQADGAGGSGAGSSSGGNAGAGGETTGTTDPGGAGGGGSTGTTGSTSSTSGSTTGTECTKADDCVALGFCSQGTCTAGTCSYMPKPLGTPVSNPVPDDCKQFVCDGDGEQTEVPADETPPQTGNDCEERVCNEGDVVIVQVNENRPCGTLDPGICKEYTCTEGLCTLKTSPDGTLLPDNDLTDCAVLQCLYGGQVYYVADDGLCNDSNPTNCTVPKCGVDQTGGTCYGVDAPSGKTCTKTNGSGGTCNSSGDCL